MAQQYDNTNKGALFGNTRKRDGKKDPDLQGKLNVDGVDHWISAWFFTYEKDGATKRGINLSLGKPCDEKKEERPAAQGGRKPAQFDDDIPF